jgi:hypothetical protein
MNQGEVKLQDVFQLPEGGIYNGGIAVCQYLNAQGEMEFGYVYDTTGLPLSSTLGLLEIAQHRLYEMTFKHDEEP